MEINLPTKYNPKVVEDKWYQFWEEGNFFHSKPDPDKEPYAIVIPPPNVTGILHIGHALNNILQDILIRWKRMQGVNSLWMPGTDHAGIATQNVVEKELAKKGKNRHKLGREKFVEEVWKWKNEYGSEILKQLRKLGSSCDWERERFTMDEGLSKAVKEAFVRLYEKGLIYKGKYIINWCPRCHTALSDDEVEHEDHEGHFWYIKYPFRDEPHLYLTIATTRPETMLGDVAVAVNPNDERYKEMIGEMLILPVVGREIPVIADDAVDPQFGTGAVKVTPAHDPNDFEIGKRHNLKAVLIMNEDGTIKGDAVDYVGMDRYECREALVEELREKKYIAKVEPHTHSVGHCYRCRTVIEPYLSDQWFVKMKPLAEKAIKAHNESGVTFYPERWSKVYLSWLENVRDWCISRQIWWGHRIPVWYCQDCKEINVSTETPDNCSKCGGNKLVQDEDVLDTWFSSALWPFSTMGWPDETEELKYYYPTNTLVTDRGIIYFWVARMVMMGLELMEKVPFSNVYIHGTILDDQGRKMSKSLGNGIDPLLMIDQYGADAVRTSIIMLTVEGQDVKLHENRFEMGRNFINKVWNASRFVMMNLECDDKSQEIVEEDYEFEDKWIRQQLSNVIDNCTNSLKKYKFNEAIKSLYEYIWNDFCDWYLEKIKPRLYGHETEKSKLVAQKTLVYVLDNILRLLHPFAPFMTEEIWQCLKGLVEKNDLISTDTMVNKSLMICPWPETRKDEAIKSSSVSGAVKIKFPTPTINITSTQIMGTLQNIVRAVRNIRSNMDIPNKQKLKALISVHDNGAGQELEKHRKFLTQMANLDDDLEIGVNLKKPDSSASEVVGDFQVFVLLEGLIDVESEKNKQLEHLKKIESYLEVVQKKLHNENFVNNAPENIVNAERDKEAELLGQITKIKEALEGFEQNASK